MVEIRLLGELEVLRDGQPVALPASRKSRALLGYLAATRKAHLRERLCELLWEGPDDPRAALRWTLSKLRPIVDTHLVAGRERVELRTDGMGVDLERLCTPANATTDALAGCAELFRGHFLEGLDLPACFRFQQWCVGERERLRQAHVAVLAELTARHAGRPEALAHARRRVAVDPFSDEAHAALIRLLGQLGQNQEALRHYEHCRQLFERELQARPGPPVEEARRGIGRAPAAPRPTAVARAEGSLPLVGRDRALAEAASGAAVVLVLGEPGIGKTRLLDELRARETGPAVHGRAFAAEMVRPYGVWIDGLRAIGRELPTESDRAHLFERVVEQLSDVALVTLDDVQWLDEASAALLHYVARSERPPRLVCGARPGEIDDNVNVSRVIRELARERRLTRVPLGPLSAEETRTLAGAVSSTADLARIVASSGGNPLFAIELSRTDDAGAAPASLSAVIADRLFRLDGPARELVSWTAAIGRQFDVDVVGRATGMPAGEMLAALEKLERCAILRPVGDHAYDFAHDLIRDAAYQALSGPRRTLVHRQIASALRATHDPEAALAGDLVHHAALAGELEVAAEAAVAAGQRCLRMFAYAEAVSVAIRALQMIDTLAPERRLDLGMRLLQVVVMARTPLADRLALAVGLAEMTERARRDGQMKTAALGALLLSILNEEQSDYARAADASLRSAEMARGADPVTTASTIANTARCLLFLQRDVERAAALLAEAQALGIENTELALGWGYLHAHYGRLAEATPHLERALVLAARDQDHWREWVALSRLAAVSLEEGRPDLARGYCARLRPVAEKMRGGSEGVKTDMLETLARFATGEAVDVEGMLARLREIDSRSDLAWALTIAAELEARGGDAESARRHATEGLAAARTVGRSSEAVIARAILGSRARLRPAERRDLTARARRYLEGRTHGRARARADV